MKAFIKPPTLAILFIYIILNNTNNAKAQKEEKNKINTPTAIEGKYKGVILGMTREQTINIIEQDIDLEIDLSSDYGDFDEEQKYLVKAQRKPFIEHIYYQFTKINNKWILYTIIINFNPLYNDYIKLHKTIKTKYGNANIMTSKYAIWTSENKYKSYDGRDITITIITHKPASIKIIDESLYEKEGVEKRKSKYAEIKTYQKEMNKRLLDDFSIENK